MKRIVYLGMIATTAYAHAVGERLYIGAAAVKMGSLVSALRISGRRAYLVSLPSPGPEASKAHYPAIATHGDGFPALFLPVSRSPILRKLRGVWTFALFAARRVRQDDIVLFYNHAAEYLLALLILRLRGVSVFQDIEDAPIAADRGLRGLLNRIGYRVMLALSSPRKVTASEQLGRELGFTDFVAIPGIAAPSGRANRRQAWTQLAEGGALRFHYGGTLTTSTGLDLFCETIEILRTSPLECSRGLTFIVTGVGDVERLKTLVPGCPPWLRIEVHGTVDRDRYDALLASCHAGLSLRLPDAAISSTTFPSKVIEITSRGLALVSFVVSDVGDIFGEQEAFLLRDPGSEGLAEVIRAMAQAPEAVRERAEAGERVALQRFAPAAVGTMLADFLAAQQKNCI